MRPGRTGVRQVIAVLLAGLAVPALAQELQDRPTVAPPSPDGAGAPTPDSEDEVTLSAAQLEYDDDADIVTATGDVRMLRAGNRLRADKVTWNRNSGEVRATGNVAIV